MKLPELDKKFLMYLAIGGAAFGLISSIPILNLVFICSCCVLPFVAAGIGYYTAKTHKVSKDQMQEGVILGAIGGLTAGIPLTVVAGIMGFIYSLLGVGIRSVGTDDTSGVFGDFAASGVSSVVGFIFSLIFALFFYSICGAIGGAIFVATNKEGEKVEVK
ncbi:MAG TPA: hypothetical protein VGA67_03925 [Candidatus Dojkabacteria bacterium]|jgi:hypothetical protein